MRKILFTTIYDPEPLLERWAATDQMAYRLTRGQGIFTLQEHAHSYPLHLLAQNVDAESVVLEWPNLEDFEEELTKADYDYVCISFMNRDMNKLRTMSKRVRSISPKSEIVIGGYGVICLSDEVNKEFEGTYDHICRTEGVAYIRSLLGENTDKPVVYRLPQEGSTLPWLSSRSRGTIGALLAGLGCTKRCPFCVTSFYTKGKFVSVNNEAELYQGMVNYWQTNPFTTSVNIYDENFLDYKDRVDELGRWIRKDTRYGLKKLNFFTFGSISAICKYDPEELLLNGLDTVWIGVESLYTRLKKTQGADAETIFRTLNEVGIKTIGSWIAGLDLQDQYNIAKDEDYFVSLNPTFQQISILTVEPSMPLARVYEKKHKKSYPWENYHLYGQTFEPKNFTFEQLLDRVEQLYDKMYQVNGASIMRMLQANLNGYKFCKQSANPLLKDDKAHHFQQKVRAYTPLIKACREFAPNSDVRNVLMDLEREVIDTFGSFSQTQIDYSEHILRKAAQEHEARQSSERPVKKDDYRRYSYPAGPKNCRGRKPYKVTYPTLRVEE